MTIRIYAILLLGMGLCAFPWGAKVRAAGGAGDKAEGTMRKETTVPREHVEEITSGRHAYRIEMGGTMDGENTRSPVGYQVYDQTFEPNVFVRMENVGDTPVVNPWLIANGRDWRTLKSIVAGVVTPEMDDAEKAMALWTFQRNLRFHATAYDNENNDPVKMLNVYGYTLCGNDSYVLADLWRAAGLKTRSGRPTGHSTTEVFYDGMWHLLDGDEHVICLMRDNRTIAGEEEIVRDHDLMKRTHIYGILRKDSRSTSEFSASLFIHEGERGRDKESFAGHRMSMTLRPGESLEWRWDGQGKFHGKENMGSWRNAWTRICNGKMVYRPDVKSDQWRYGAVETKNVPAEGALRAFRTAQSGRTFAIFEVKSPYAIVGGRIRAEFERAGMDDRASLAVSFDRDHWTEVWTAGPLGESRADVSLDRHFPPEERARYGYFVRVSLNGDAEIEGLMLESDVQMAPLSLPGVRLGENEMVYVDETEGPRQVRVSHVWQECSESSPPSAPEKPVFPEDGADVEGMKFAFEWAPSEDPDGRGIADYRFQLSAREDMKYVLSPNFDKLNSRTAQKGEARYEIPYVGLLNPGETYYWRVRARNEAGMWSAWSPVWKFTPQGPGVPLDVALDADREKRTAALSWKPNPQGRTPVKYRVYGSDERGFTASDEPYPVTVTREQETFPANFIAEVEGTSLQVVGTEPDSSRGNRAFYRVVAVDAEGVSSGPSDYAEMARPLICSSPVEQAAVGEGYRYQVEVVKSIGDLRTARIEGSPYNPAFRDGDVLTFVLDEAPDWLSVDEKLGTVSGQPKSAGKFPVKVRVVREQGGEDAQRYEVVVE